MHNRVAALERLGLPTQDLYDLPSSEKRFPDGGQFRLEIPHTESPEQLKTIIEASNGYGLTVHRVAQDSGITLLTDSQIEEMAALGKSEGIEVCLFTGPRAEYDIGGQVKAPSGGILTKRIRGMDQLVYAIEDVFRAARLGIRSFLVADEGLLWVLGEMRKNDEIPKNSVIKVSISVGQANPASARIIENLGGGTFNIPSDLNLAQIAAIRRAINIPIDLYVTTPGNLGGFVRVQEAAEIVKVAAPIYLKFGIPLPMSVVPAGEHVKSTLIPFSQEEVRLAKLTFDLIRSRAPQIQISGRRAREPGIPE
jgi:hypothetical protein